MTKQTILVIGSGGREHALLWKIAQSPRAGKLYIAPGNGGTQQLAESVDIAANDIPRLVTFALENQVDVTVVGPDDPLAAGIVDAFEKLGLRVFGPTSAAAQIEASKAFSKALMAKRGIPTAQFQVFTTMEEALVFIQTAHLPLVVKASGLSLGKGVYICQTHEEAHVAVRSIMDERIFGDAGNQVVIEEFLEGQEVSIHALSDGKSSFLFPPSQDHKQIFDGDKGPNTGGMGAYAPVPWVTDEQMSGIQQQTVQPVLNELAQRGSAFVGCLYPGLKMTAAGPKVLEYNARFGDPETQVYLRLLDSDLLDVIDACIDGAIDQLEVSWKPGFAITVALVPGGYPGEYKKGLSITGLAEAAVQPDIVVFHGGTTYADGEYRSAGGRVLHVTATGDSLDEARAKAYAAVKLIHFEGMRYRNDIGEKGLVHD